jgi:hypothetical protein
MLEASTCIYGRSQIILKRMMAVRHPFGIDALIPRQVGQDEFSIDGSHFVELHSVNAAGYKDDGRSRRLGGMPCLVTGFAHRQCHRVPK